VAAHLAALSFGRVARYGVNVRGAGSVVARRYRLQEVLGLTHTIVEGRTRSDELRRAELEERFPGLPEFLRAAAAREFAAPGGG
jgi:hypothetical protein